MQTINEIGRALAATLDLSTLFETMYEQVGRVMDTSLFSIALLSQKRTTVEISYLREQGKLFLDEVVPYGNNLTSMVIDHGDPVSFHAFEQYQEFCRVHSLATGSIGEHDPESMIFVPLNTGNRTIGVLSVQSLTRHAYSGDDVQTLSVIASQAAVAIENANLLLQSQNTVRQTRALLQVAQVVNSSLDLQTVLDSVLQGMRDVMPYHLASILMPDHRAQELQIVGVVGPVSEETRQQLRIPFGCGVTGSVFVSGKLLNIPNVSKHRDYLPHGVDEIRSEMAVPLTRGETVIGVLDVGRAELDGFASEAVDLMVLFASQAAIAIENARLFAEQQSRVFELQTIQTIAQQITPLHDIPSIVQVVNAELRRHIDFEACHVFLLEEDGALLPVTLPGENATGNELTRAQVIGEWIVEKDEPAFVSDSALDERTAPVKGMAAPGESIIGAPLVYEERVRGVITLSKSGKNQFDDNHLRLLDITSAQTAIAFDRARLYQELRTEAITDPLTRLSNRRYLLDRFKEERSRAIRNGHNLAVIMIDIDKFKQVNDKYGHDAGDFVLRELAEIVRGMLRLEQLVARYGGEEFCVLLPEMTLSDAHDIAHRLIATIAQHSVPVGATKVQVTVSIGMALLSIEDEGVEAFSRADRAMYFAKGMGGNRVGIDGGTGGALYWLDEFGRPTD